MSRKALESKTNIIAGVIALVVAASGGAFLLTRPGDKPASTNATSQQTAPKTGKESAAVVTADHISYKGEEGRTALELLKKHTTVQTKTYDFGELVTAINGQDGGGTKYWTFYVNGAEAQVGAGAYATKGDDKIEWKLR